MHPDTTEFAARPTPNLRVCGADEAGDILAIVNAAAIAYRGRIPADCWHAPYMRADALAAEIAAGVRFTGCVLDGRLAGVMGIQRVRNVDLIRHAYVRPAFQGQGIGSVLIAHLRAGPARPILIGTWAAADWAIAFYRRHGFGLVPDEVQAPLLRTYWTIPERQIEASVVLAAPALDHEAALALIEAARE